MVKIGTEKCVFVGASYIIHKSCYESSDGKGTENVAGKTGQDIKW